MTSSTGDWGAAADRTARLDAALDGVQIPPQFSGDLFAVVDLLVGQPALTRALTDPGIDLEARQGLAQRLLKGQVSTETLAVLDAAIAIRWATPGELTAGLERQAVRALLLEAAGHGDADRVEEELFRLRQTVLGDVDLSAAVEDLDREVADRRLLVEHVLAGRAAPQTQQLAERAVPTTGRGHFEQTLAGYLELSADLRGSAIAVVTTARGLTAEQRDEMIRQLERITEHPIDLREVVDPQVLGGARINLTDEVVDGTVASRLDQARRALG